MKNLLIKNAKLRYTNELTDILICDGIFQKIGKITDPPADTEIIDATGNLVTPPIIDPHVHLDAVLVAGILPRRKSDRHPSGIHRYLERLETGANKRNLKRKRQKSY